MQAEIVAVGTELLLGQILDTNTRWLADQLARHGIACMFQTRVGDNEARIADVLRAALARNDAAVVTGGLGPTPDDVTREAIAAVMGVELLRRPELLETVRARFASRGRAMPASNERQADVPVGASVIPQRIGTAPGLVCPVGDKVIYAMPGVPAEMQEMSERVVLLDLVRRSGRPGVIVSRVLRTWGASESAVAEAISARLAALDRQPDGPTIAFLANAEGVAVRVTLHETDERVASARLDAEELALRALIGEVVFGTDDETLESVLGESLVSRGETLAVAESLTGGMVSSRLVGVPGASRWFRGGVVSYASEVKRRLLGASEGPVVSAEAARAMAEGVRSLLGAGVGLALTGVAGPETQDGEPVGTVFVGMAGPGASSEVRRLSLSPGSRDTLRVHAALGAMDALRRRLAVAAA